MDKNTYSKPFGIPSFLGIFFLFYGLALHGLETKRFDAPPPKRPTYLSFAKPTPLRFSISPQPVDRFNIALPASQPIVQASVVTQISADANQTASLPVPSMPTQYDQNSSSTPAFQSPQKNSSPFLPQLAPPASLPLSDPFSGFGCFREPIRPMSFCGSSKIPTWALPVLLFRHPLSFHPIRSLPMG